MLREMVGSAFDFRKLCYSPGGGRGSINSPVSGGGGSRCNCTAAKAATKAVRKKLESVLAYLGKKELRAMCLFYGLSIEGSKKELRARIQNS